MIGLKKRKSGQKIIRLILALRPQFHLKQRMKE